MDWAGASHTFGEMLAAHTKPGLSCHYTRVLPSHPQRVQVVELGAGAAHSERVVPHHLQKGVAWGCRGHGAHASTCACEIMLRRCMANAQQYLASLQVFPRLCWRGTHPVGVGCHKLLRRHPVARGQGGVGPSRHQRRRRSAERLPALRAAQRSAEVATALRPPH